MVTFLDLPPEIRNRVYVYTEELYAEEDPNDHCWLSLFGVQHKSQFWMIYNPVPYIAWVTPEDSEPREPSREYIALPAQPAISKTCRQVREETLAIFYGANSFTFQDSYCPLPSQDEVYTPFPTVVFEALNRIRPHLPLMTDVGLYVLGDTIAEQVIADFMDYGFDFRIDALKVRGPKGQVMPHRNRWDTEGPPVAVGYE